MSDTCVTFIVVGYNQEGFIRAAIHGALAQTYSPLEIILSDDCSSDQTYEIMCTLAAQYRGRHVIKTRRSEKNAGTLGDHLNLAMHEASGELIVIASGDDVSCPSRVTKLVDFWKKNGRPVGSLFSGALETDEALIPFGCSTPESWKSDKTHELIQGEPQYIVGCTHAWHKEVFSFFGPLTPGVVNEDSALAFRSALLGGIFCLPDPLVMHRRHISNSGNSGSSYLETYEDICFAWRVSLTRRQALLRSFRSDLSLAREDRTAAIQYNRAELTVMDNRCQQVDSNCVSILNAIERPWAKRKLELLRLIWHLNDRRAAWQMLRHLLFPQIWLIVRKLRRLRFVNGFRRRNTPRLNRLF